MNKPFGPNLVKSILQHIQQKHEKNPKCSFDLNERFVDSQTMDDLYDVLRVMTKDGYIWGKLVEEKQEGCQNFHACFKIGILSAGYNLLFEYNPELLEKALLELADASFPLRDTEDN